MANFKKLNTRVFTKVHSESTPDKEYWKKLSAPVLVKEFGPIDYIDFSPVEPYYFAVTCSVRVQVYNPVTKLVTKNLSRFRANTYGATFRADGRLICAGGEEAHVKLFDVGSKSLLRIFAGHTAPVHRAFFTHDNLHVASFSDDKSVRVWDIATEKAMCCYSEHTDYVRAGAVSPVVPDIILSGGYDSVVKMYDSRTSSVVLSVEHGSPVESLLFLPSGSLFLTAGGTEIKIWDAVAGGRLLGCVSQHHKTVTCLRLASDGRRLLSASLDRHVNVYDVASFRVVHTFSYPNAVLSLGVSKNDETLVAGMVDGLVAVQRRDEPTRAPKAQRKLVSENMQQVKSVDAVVQGRERTAPLTRHDLCLKKFRFAKALSCVLNRRTIYLQPEAIHVVLQELLKRRALQKALARQDATHLELLLHFLVKYVTDYQYTRSLLEVADALLEFLEGNVQLYSGGMGRLLTSLSHRLHDEQALAEQLAHVQGALQLLVAGASAPQHVQGGAAAPSHHSLVPSADAQKNLIVNLT